MKVEREKKGASVIVTKVAEERNNAQIRLQNYETAEKTVIRTAELRDESQNYESATTYTTTIIGATTYKFSLSLSLAPDNNAESFFVKRHNICMYMVACHEFNFLSLTSPKSNVFS